jgi:hypothetical protein
MRGSWKRAYDTQMAVWRWLSSEHGQRWLYERWRSETDGLHINTRLMTKYLYAGLDRMVRTADPIFISAEMCDVVEAAAVSFEPEPVYPTDVLTGQGFMFFERPFVIPDREGNPITIQGASWGLIITDDTEEERDGPLVLPEGVDEMDYMRERHEAGKHDGLGFTLYTIPKPERWAENFPDVQMPPLAPVHVTPWWWGMTFDGNEVDEQGRPTAAEHWWKIAQVTWRLMQQHIAVRHKERPDRPQRREAQRNRMSNLAGKEVLVVRLRREKAEPHPDHVPGEAHYSHRFIRNAHWRWQYYPSLQGHRQIWIHQTVVGDESLPLVLKPRRVFVWDR